MVRRLILSAVVVAHAASAQGAAIDTVTGLSLLQLMSLSSEDLVSLLDVDALTRPAAVTVITREDIQRCGARNLPDLIRAYVPGAWLMQHAGFRYGLRGISSDRNTKVLMLINGRNVNFKVDWGGAPGPGQLGT